jgi:nicotinamide-nucleotide amidase
MNRNLESALRYLEDNQLKLVTAESCTAGLTASLLAEQPGSGSWLDCAFVTYSVNAKCSLLGVSKETIDREGLTSEAVAREMAEGALRLSRANVALADTGLAGPEGMDGIAPGTICLAWSFEREGHCQTFSETRKFEGDRNQTRQSAAEYMIGRIWHYHSEMLRLESKGN